MAAGAEAKMAAVWEVAAREAEDKAEWLKAGKAHFDVLAHARKAKDTAKWLKHANAYLSCVRKLDPPNRAAELVGCEERTDATAAANAGPDAVAEAARETLAVLDAMGDAEGDAVHRKRARANASRRLLICHYQKKEWAEAVVAGDAYLAAVGDAATFDVVANLGNACFYGKDYDAAEKHLGRAVDMATKAGEAAAAASIAKVRASALQKLNRGAEAGAIYTQLATAAGEGPGGSGETPADRAAYLYRAGVSHTDHAERIKCFDRALAVLREDLATTSDGATPDETKKLLGRILLDKWNELHGGDAPYDARAAHLREYAADIAAKHAKGDLSFVQYQLGIVLRRLATDASKQGGPAAARAPKLWADAAAAFEESAALTEYDPKEDANRFGAVERTVEAHRLAAICHEKASAASAGAVDSAIAQLEAAANVADRMRGDAPRPEDAALLWLSASARLANKCLVFGIQKGLKAEYVAKAHTVRRAMVKCLEDENSAESRCKDARLHLTQSCNDISISYDNLRQAHSNQSDEWGKLSSKCAKWLRKYIEGLHKIVLDKAATVEEHELLKTNLPRLLDDSIILATALRQIGDNEAALEALEIVQGLLEDPTPLRREDATYNADDIIRAWSLEKVRLLSEASTNLRSLGRVDEARAVLNSSGAESPIASATKDGAQLAGRAEPGAVLSHRRRIEGMIDVARHLSEALDSDVALQKYIEVLDCLDALQPADLADGALVESPEATMARLKLRARRGKNMICFRLGELDMAKVEAEAAVKLADELGSINKDRGVIGAVDEGASEASESEGVAGRARRVGTMRKEVVERNGELIERANCWHDLGQIYQMVGEYGSCIDAVRKALGHAMEARSVGDSKYDHKEVMQIERKCLSSLGNAYLAQRDYDQAEHFMRRGLKIATESGENIAQSMACCDLGNLYYYKHKPEENASADGTPTRTASANLVEAEKHLLQALEFAAKAGAKSEIMRTNGNLANVYLAMADAEKAMEYNQKTALIAEELMDRIHESRAHGNISDIYMKLHKLPVEAEKNFRVFMDKARASGDKEGLMWACGRLGNLCSDVANVLIGKELPVLVTPANGGPAVVKLSGFNLTDLLRNGDGNFISADAESCIAELRDTLASHSDDHDKMFRMREKLKVLSIVAAKQRFEQSREWFVEMKSVTSSMGVNQDMSLSVEGINNATERLRHIQLTENKAKAASGRSTRHKIREFGSIFKLQDDPIWDMCRRVYRIIEGRSQKWRFMDVHDETTGDDLSERRRHIVGLTEELFLNSRDAHDKRAQLKRVLKRRDQFHIGMECPYCGSDGIIPRNEAALARPEYAKVKREKWRSLPPKVLGDICRFCDGLVSVNAVDGRKTGDERIGKRRTALHYAAESGNIKCVKFLVEGADAVVNCETDPFDPMKQSYRTPYQLALENGHKHIAEYLKNEIGVVPIVTTDVRKKVDNRRIESPQTNQQAHEHYYAWDGTINDEETGMDDHQAKDAHRRTTLMIACFRGHRLWVEERVRRDLSRLRRDGAACGVAPISAVVDNEGWTALHWCCRSTSEASAALSANDRRKMKTDFQTNQVAIAQVLLDAEASIAALIGKDKRGGANALHDVTSLSGETPLAMARRMGHTELAKFLASKGGRMHGPLWWGLRYILFFALQIVYGVLFPVLVFASYIKGRRITRLLGRLPSSVQMIVMGYEGTLDEGSNSAPAGGRSDVTPAQGGGPALGTDAGLGADDSDDEEYGADNTAQHSATRDSKKDAKPSKERTAFALSLAFIASLWLYPYFFVRFMANDASMKVMGAFDRTAFSFGSIGLFYFLTSLFLTWTVFKTTPEDEFHMVRHPQKRMRLALKYKVDESMLTSEETIDSHADIEYGESTGGDAVGLHPGKSTMSRRPSAASKLPRTDSSKSTRSLTSATSRTSSHRSVSSINIVDPDAFRLDVLWFTFKRFFNTALRFAVLIYDFIAFARFALPDPDFIWAQGDNDEYKVVSAMAGYGDKAVGWFSNLQSYPVIFWSSAAVVILWFLLSSYMCLSMVVLQMPRLRAIFPFITLDFYAKLFVPLDIFIPILAVALFLPVSLALFSPLNCMYEPVASFWTDVELAQRWLVQTGCSAEAYRHEWRLQDAQWCPSLHHLANAADGTSDWPGASKESELWNATIAACYPSGFRSKCGTSSQCSDAEEKTAWQELCTIAALSTNATNATNATALLNTSACDGARDLAIKVNSTFNATDLITSFECDSDGANVTKCSTATARKSLHEMNVTDAYALALELARVLNYTEAIPWYNATIRLSHNLTRVECTRCVGNCSTASCACGSCAMTFAEGPNNSRGLVERKAVFDEIRTYAHQEMGTEIPLQSDKVDRPLGSDKAVAACKSRCFVVEECYERCRRTCQGTSPPVAHVNDTQRCSRDTFEYVEPVCENECASQCGQPCHPPRILERSNLERDRWRTCRMFDECHASNSSDKPAGLDVGRSFFDVTERMTRRQQVESLASARLPSPLQEYKQRVVACTTDMEFSRFERSVLKTEGWFHCPRGVPECMAKQPQIACWNDPRKDMPNTENNVFYAWFGLTYLVYWIPSCLVLGMYFIEPDEDTCDIRFSVAYTQLETACKWITSLVSVMMQRVRFIPQLTTFVASFVLMVVTAVWQPCHDMWRINHYRVWAFAANALIPLAAIVNPVSMEYSIAVIFGFCLSMALAWDAYHNWDELRAWIGSLRSQGIGGGEAREPAPALELATARSSPGNGNAAARPSISNPIFAAEASGDDGGGPRGGTISIAMSGASDSVASDGRKSFANPLCTPAR